jgi:hypothetical protein
VTDFHVDTSNVVSTEFGGFGAQYNQNVYAPISHAAGVTDENVLVMEQGLTDLKPHLARVFFDGKALTDGDLMTSFVRTMKLAQNTASAINVTFHGIGPHAFPDSMPQFAAVLHDLIANQHVTKLKWVTIRNEPNVPPIPKDLYKSLYAQLAAGLAGLGVQLKFMGGDLRIEHQAEWFNFLAHDMRGMLDAYSIHVYWNYFDPTNDLHGIESRLSGVQAIWEKLGKKLGKAAQKPLYVTEFGCRGNPHGAEENQPGVHKDGVTPLSKTNINAFQHAWFSLRAAMLGYSGTIKWDAYFAMYDHHPQGYALLGHPNDGWPRQPVYSLLRLLTTTVIPGSSVVAVDGAGPEKIVVAFVAPTGRLTILGMDTDGNEHDATSPEQRPYRVSGLTPNTTFQLRFWNFDGRGANSAPARPRTDGAGTLSVSAPLRSVFALTSVPGA